MLNDSGKKGVITYLMGALTVGAVGDGSTPPQVSDTQLVHQTYEKAVSDALLDGTTLIKEIFLDETEGNGSVTEIGIKLDDGTLFSSFGNLVITKDNTQSLTLSFEIDVAEYTAGDGGLTFGDMGGLTWAELEGL